MDSVGDDAKAPGCPIRISSDQRLLPPPRSFSQGATSFIVSRCQGIHQMPLSCLRAASMRRDKAHAHERHSLKASPLPESRLSFINEALRCYSRSTLPGSLPSPVDSRCTHSHVSCDSRVRMTHPTGWEKDRWYPPAIPSSRTAEGQNPIHDVKEPNAKTNLPAKRSFFSMTPVRSANRKSGRRNRPKRIARRVVEPDGIEPTTSSLQS